MSILDKHECHHIRGLRRVPPVDDKTPTEPLLPRGLRVIKGD